MKKYFFIAVVAFAAVAVFIGISADDDLDQTRAINDKKEACLKHQLDKDLNDDCKAIIRDLKIRGEEYGF